MLSSNNSAGSKRSEIKKKIEAREVRTANNNIFNFYTSVSLRAIINCVDMSLIGEMKHSYIVFSKYVGLYIYHQTLIYD